MVTGERNKDGSVPTIEGDVRVDKTRGGHGNHMAEASNISSEAEKNEKIIYRRADPDAKPSEKSSPYNIPKLNQSESAQSGSRSSSGIVGDQVCSMCGGSGRSGGGGNPMEVTDPNPNPNPNPNP